MQRFNQSTVVRNQDSLLKTHSVLRNTYILLGFTLLFSSGCAALAVNMQASFGAAIATSILALVLLFVTSALRNSAWGIVAVFAFTGCMGYSMGPMLNHFIHGYTNGGKLIITALGGTGITFFVSSAYIIATKKDLSGWSKTLTIGLIVCLVAIIANLFLKMPAMQLGISCLLIFISTMLMMYDTSRIINNGETNYIMATISLFIDIQMLFQNLLNLLGVFGNRE